MVVCRPITYRNSVIHDGIMQGCAIPADQNYRNAGSLHPHMQHLVTQRTLKHGTGKPSTRFKANAARKAGTLRIQYSRHTRLTLHRAFIETAGNWMRQSAVNCLGALPIQPPAAIIHTAPTFVLDYIPSFVRCYECFPLLKYYLSPNRTSHLASETIAAS